MPSYAELQCVTNFSFLRGGSHGEELVARAQELGIKALAGAIVGGFGSIPGALLGCLLIGVIEPFSDYYFPEIKGVSPYIVMLLVLFIRPEGIISQTFQKKV